MEKFSFKMISDSFLDFFDKYAKEKIDNNNFLIFCEFTWRLPSKTK